jgi:hypothetical protein
MHPSSDIILLLLESVEGVRRDCLAACGEFVFAEMLTRSAAVEQII